MDADVAEIDERFWEYDEFGRPLDPETRERRALLKQLIELSDKEFFAHLVECGIYNPDGTLTEHYRDDGEPSLYRPTDAVGHDVTDEESTLLGEAPAARRYPDHVGRGAEPHLSCEAVRSNGAGGDEDVAELDERFFEYDEFGQPLDPETRHRRALLKQLIELSDDEFFAHLVKCGIYHPDGTLTEHYRDDGEPSLCRPTD